MGQIIPSCRVMRDHPQTLTTFLNFFSFLCCFQINLFAIHCSETNSKSLYLPIFKNFSKRRCTILEFVHIWVKLSQPPCFEAHNFVTICLNITKPGRIINVDSIAHVVVLLYQWDLQLDPAVSFSTSKQPTPVKLVKYIKNRNALFIVEMHLATQS